MKLLNKVLIVLISNLLILLLACEDNITGRGNETLKIWFGQVISEFVYAILKPDSTVWTWGPNFNGTLGNGTNNSSDYPIQVLNLKNVLSMDFYWGAAFAVDKDGNIWFWGNYATHLGPPSIDTNTTIPTKIAYLQNVSRISVWDLKVYLLTEEGSVWYLTMDAYSPSIYEGPLQYTEMNNIVAIHNFCALRSDGDIYILGINERIENVPQNVILFQSTQQRKVVLKNDGNVWAWGKNNLGQLGNGTFEDSNVPTKVKNLSNVVAISSNYDFNLALKKDGTVWFWGYSGQDEDTLVGLNIPVKIEGLDDIVLIYASSENLVMKSDGSYFTFSFDERIPKEVYFR
jgi:alpha-tubulin suppressor-like RCC1 family protein